jgi:plasmid maintenance system antidote protein VapI
LPHERKARESRMAKSFDELVRRTTTKQTSQRAAARTREFLGELLLSEIRERAGKSQRQVADALGIRQPSLSKLEKQSDMQISTLRRIVKALGGELEVLARFPAGTVKIEPFNEMGSSEAVSP